jgi:hypothetical protein
VPILSGVGHGAPRAFVRSAIDVLEQLGALAHDGDRVALTPVGAFGFRFWLVDEAGRDAPVIATP